MRYARETCFFVGSLPLSAALASSQSSPLVSIFAKTRVTEARVAPAAAVRPAMPALAFQGAGERRPAATALAVTAQAGRRRAAPARAARLRAAPARGVAEERASAAAFRFRTSR